MDGRRQLETLENIQLYEYDLKHEFDKDGANVHETGGTNNLIDALCS